MNRKFAKTAYITICTLAALYIAYTVINIFTNDKTSITALMNASSPKIEFANEEYNFGTLTDGASIKYFFKFSNNGKSPLIIYNVSTTCGCTIASWPKKPIPPGSIDSIGIVYKTHGNLGYTDKMITVKSNSTFPEKKLIFQGRVIKIFKRDHSNTKAS